MNKYLLGPSSNDDHHFFSLIFQKHITNILVIDKNRKKIDALGFNQCKILANGLTIEYM